MLQIEASLTDDSGGIIYYYTVFFNKKQATGWEVKLMPRSHKYLTDGPINLRCFGSGKHFWSSVI
jgi:hypothetical protein